MSEGGSECTIQRNSDGSNQELYLFLELLYLYLAPFSVRPPPRKGAIPTDVSWSSRQQSDENVGTTPTLTGRSKKRPPRIRLPPYRPRRPRSASPGGRSPLERSSNDRRCRGFLLARPLRGVIGAGRSGRRAGRSIPELRFRRARRWRPRRSCSLRVAGIDAQPKEKRLPPFRPRRWISGPRGPS